MNKILPVIMLLVWVLSGCNENHRDDLEELEFMRKRWANLELKNYEYVAGYNCYCGGAGPYTLKFSNNELDTVYYTDSEIEEADYEAILNRTDDLIIESLFQRIEENIKRDPHSFSVEYDDEYFFPKEAYFDFHKETIDEEMGYYVNDFSSPTFP